jgi:2-polyprenyl-3-methyl-5-hydroxy-6-metoxy-1,4-benzoquinol methylase
MDAEEYLGMRVDAMGPLAWNYNTEEIKEHKDDIVGYYGSRGKEQLARQVLFHHTPDMVRQMELFHNVINTNAEGYGADIGCGSAPVTFELAMRGHKFDFIDIEGSAAYEFTKWRAKKRGVLDRVGFELKGPYDYIFMLDSLEHIEDWKGMLDKVHSYLKEGGAFITNYFWNRDFQNPEHISMDQPAVKKYLVSLGIYPSNEFLWVKNAKLGAMDKGAA